MFLAHRLCAWSGLLLTVLFLIGFWIIAGFVPPPDPASGPEEIARRFSDDADRIRVGMIISSLAAMLLIPWAAAIRTQLRRIEGPNDLWAPIQFVSAALS